MSKRAALIDKYAADLKEKCGITADMALLTKVTIACGPTIYNADSSTVSGGSEGEMATVQKNFVMKKLGLTDEAAAMAAVEKAVETYGKSNRNKYRAALYYIIVKDLGKESVFA